jgi:signal transduction histidine kinase
LDVQPFACLVVEAGTGQVIYSNATARQLFGTPADALATACFATDEAGERIETTALAKQLIARAAGPDGMEIVWHTPERARTCLAFCRPLTEANGPTPLAVLTFLDISRQKTAEAGLRQALEARDEFFSVATHELKDPLFSLQLSIQLLRRSAHKQGAVPPHIVQHLEVSERQVQRLAGLIDNLLDIARLMNHRLCLETEAVDLCELAQETVNRFQTRAETVSTQLQAVTCETLIAYGDRLKLEQVLSNLISNALKYGAGRPVTVRVHSDADHAILEVEDQGPGIAPEDQERIFNRFERASERHRQESLGLGLYIVRSLVEAHGGTVRVRSQPGQGTTFTVKLPRMRLHRPEEQNDEIRSPNDERNPKPE